MKKTMMSIMLLLALIGHTQTLQLGRGVYSNDKIPFISHQGDTPFSNYLSMEINYPPIQKLRLDLERSLGRNLRHRGEAHITVITPVEYNEALRSHVTIQEIDVIARNEKIQASRFRVVCLGRGSAVKNNEKMHTYFLVVESPDLLRIRSKIRDLFRARGGDPGAFVANKFYPHITLAFTHDDLYESDGVIKNRKSCIERIDLY